MSARIGFWSSMALAAVLSLGAAPAHALTTLVTSDLTGGIGDFILCRLVNVGPRDITVTLQMIDQSGLILEESEQVITPGTRGFLIHSEFTSAYCRFVGFFSKTLVRGSIDILSNGRSIVALPAQ